MLQNNVIIRKNLTPRTGKRPENVIFFTCAIDPRIDILSSIYDNGSNYTCVDINNPEYRLLRCFLKCSKILRKMGVSLNRLGAKTDASRLHTHKLYRNSVRATSRGSSWEVRVYFLYRWASRSLISAVTARGAHHDDGGRDSERQVTSSLHLSSISCSDKLVRLGQGRSSY